MKRILFLVLSGFIFLNMSAQKKLVANTGETQLHWLGEKVTGQHQGTVNLKSGWLQWQNNRITAGEFLIDMTSIKDEDNSQKLEGHLKSDDFFGVDKYPTAKLVVTESTSFDKGTATVKGNLTIKNSTHPIEFKATVQQKEEGMSFFANITIDRSKYNVRYGSGSFFDNLGDKTIYDEFKLRVTLVVN